MNTQTAHAHEAAFVNRTGAHWSAILTAAVIALVVQVTLGLIGIAMGLAAVGPTTGQPLGVDSLPAAAGLWWLLSATVSLFIGGAIAGYMARTSRIAEAVIEGGAIWALAAIAFAWFATTTVGSGLSGAMGLLMSNDRAADRRVEVAIEPSAASPPATQAPGPNQSTTAPGAQTATAKDKRAGKPNSAPEAQSGSESDLEKSLEALTWMAVVETARQLKDPEVRAMIRRYAVDTWQANREARADLAATIDNWIASGAAASDSTARAVERTLQNILLLTPAEAQRTVTRWSEEMAKQAGLPISQKASSRHGAAQSIEDDQPGQQRGKQPTSPKQDDAVEKSTQRQAEDTSRTGQEASEMASPSIDVIAALSSLREQLQEMVSASGVLSADERRQMLEALQDELSQTEAEAEQILARWERNAKSAAAELQRAAGAAADQTASVAAKTAENVLETISLAAGWVAASLVLGWLAAALGALVGGQLDISQTRRETS